MRRGLGFIINVTVSDGWLTSFPVSQSALCIGEAEGRLLL
jgi:hypothetical protein